MKVIINRLNIEIDVSEDLMVNIEDDNRLPPAKTPIKLYVLEMLYSAYDVALKDLLDTPNNDASEIITNFKKQCNNA
ncbi:hypothetical protein GOP47_0026870 [Adiantum capillus-veneris]|nr:hypothetical protein GOP47_0026870 [Adiantum capillus-veneris]